MSFKDLINAYNKNMLSLALDNLGESLITDASLNHDLLEKVLELMGISSCVNIIIIYQDILNILNFEISFVDDNQVKQTEQVKKFLLDMKNEGSCCERECPHVKGGRACMHSDKDKLINGRMHSISSPHHLEKTYIHHLIMATLQALNKAIQNDVKLHMLKIIGITTFFHDIAKGITEKVHCTPSHVFTSNPTHELVGAQIALLMSEALYSVDFCVKDDFKATIKAVPMIIIAISQHRCYNYKQPILDDERSIFVLKMYYNIYGEDLLILMKYLGWGDLLGRIINPETPELENYEELTLVKLEYFLNKLREKAHSNKVCLLIAGPPQSGKTSISEFVQRQLSINHGYISRDITLMRYMVESTIDSEGKYYALIYSLYSSIITWLSIRLDIKHGKGQKTSLDRQASQIRDILKDLSEKEIIVRKEFIEFEILPSNYSIINQLDSLFRNEIEKLIQIYDLVIIETMKNGYPDKSHHPTIMGGTTNIILHVSSFTGVSEESLNKLGLSREQYFKENPPSPFDKITLSASSFVSDKQTSAHETIHAILPPIVRTYNGNEFHTFNGIDILKTFLQSLEQNIKTHDGRLKQDGIFPGWSLETRTNVITLLNKCLEVSKEKGIPFRDYMMSTFGMTVKNIENSTSFVVIKYLHNSSPEMKKLQMFCFSLRQLRGMRVIINLETNEVETYIPCLSHCPEVELFKNVQQGSLSEPCSMLPREYIKALGQLKSSEIFKIKLASKVDGQLLNCCFVFSNDITSIVSSINSMKTIEQKYILRILEESLIISKGLHAIFIFSSSALFPKIDMIQTWLECFILSVNIEGKSILTLDDIDKMIKDKEDIMSNQDARNCVFEELFDKYIKFILYNIYSTFDSKLILPCVYCFEATIAGNKSKLTGVENREIACISKVTQVYLIAILQKDTKPLYGEEVSHTTWLCPPSWIISSPNLDDFLKTYDDCLKDPTQDLFVKYPCESHCHTLSYEGVMIHMDSEEVPDGILSGKGKTAQYYEQHSKAPSSGTTMTVSEEQAFSTVVRQQTDETMLKNILIQFGQDMKTWFEKINDEIEHFKNGDFSNIKHSILALITQYAFKLIPSLSEDTREQLKTLNFETIEDIESVRTQFKEIINGKKFAFKGILEFKSGITQTIVFGSISHNPKDEKKMPIISPIILEMSHEILRELIPTLKDIENKKVVELILVLIKGPGAKPWVSDKWESHVNEVMKSDDPLLLQLNDPLLVN